MNTRKSVTELMKESEVVKRNLITKLESSGFLTDEESKQLKNAEAELSSYWFIIGGV